MEKFLALWLEGPLQAWGYDSRFDTRRTLDFPTRSGLTGLLLAASGDSGPQEELLAQLASFPLTVYGCGEVTPVLTDFHMVGNGYDSSSDWEKLMILRNRNHKIPNAQGNTQGGYRVSRRHYLVDRCFAAIWRMPESFADKFAAALQAPVYDIFLGRKCCVPSELVFQGCFDDEAGALAHLCELAQAKGRTLCRRYREVPDSEADEETLLLADVPVRFGLHKLFRERNVKKEELEPES